jgi:predicted flap endonuclease-1-like 5' DNA nuclease
VSWFVIQSLLIIVLAFLLGLLVGWLWWGRQWRKVRFSESDAITTVTNRHQAALKEKLKDRDAALESRDAEIARLGSLVPDGASESADLHQAALASKDAEIARLAGLLDQAGGATGIHQAALADKDALLADKDALLSGKDALLSGKDAAIADRDALLSERESLLNDKNAALADKDAALHARDAEIARLSTLIGEAETAVTSHREELAARQNAIADRDAEIARLTAAAEAAASTAPATSALPLVGEARVANGTAAAEPAAPAATADPTAVIDVSAAEAVTNDDLERVEGIGPRIGAALRDAGIHSFRQLADAEAATLQGALEKAGLRFAPSLPTWSRQARLLADGDEAGFVRLTESLVAGRDVSGTA